MLTSTLWSPDRPTDRPPHWCPSLVSPSDLLLPDDDREERRRRRRTALAAAERSASEGFGGETSLSVGAHLGRMPRDQGSSHMLRLQSELIHMAFEVAGEVKLRFCGKSKCAQSLGTSPYFRAPHCSTLAGEVIHHPGEERERGNPPCILTRAMKH